MDLLSAFRRKTPPTAAPADAGDEVQRARTRARQRLIGAAVLVVAGIVGFPLLFGTQPRPIPVDLPIEIPRKDAVPPLAMPAPASAPAPAVASAPARPSPTGPVERVITETQADAGREVAAPAASAVASTPSSTASAGRPASAATAATRASAPATAPSAQADAARAQALLDGKPAPGAAGDAVAGVPRFVVQVGAFAEEGAAREARAKVEKLGLKTYTQVAETPSGPRTRVRVGPFATRDEAERAAAKLKSASMPAVILTL